MNGPQLRALVADAIYQVLDNWVFRILACLTVLPILLTFLIGFRDDQIVFLFGLKAWKYDDLFSMFGGGDLGMGIQDAQGMVIEVILTIVFDYLAGSIGVLFCIAAAAFFVPRMIEKGAADVLFHKPLGRFTLYLSRFLAGLLFIGMVSAIMVFGMYLGILVVSGRNDPGILFGAVSLTYLFGLVYSVCMLVGILTRSTVASILLTVLFFFFNGCVHQTWISIEQVKAASEVPEQTDLEDEAEEVLDEEEDDEDDDGLVKRTFFYVLNGLHYTLPKTTDTEYIARKIRRAVDPPLYKDDRSMVTVYRLPDETEEQKSGAIDAGSLPADIQALLGEPKFGARSSDDRVAYSLWLRPVEVTETERNGKTRIRRETTSKAASALEDRLQEIARDAEVERKTTIFASSSKGSPINSYRLDWKEDGPGGTWTRAAFVFKGGDAEWVFTALVDVHEETTPEQMEEDVKALAVTMGRDDSILNKPSWYEEQLSLGANWKFNILFSLGSSFAFVAAMLLLGGWRLSRIEF